ncbi:ABC transporter ATP-binding protein [Paenibacillus selenitireducens]|uniref:ABC transporter ATP-binding protein n=1 Tax=Paenibacillus selenitireducens TaxID=1324314 RepID=A0A1T2X7G7_9BACL|nr:ABC transporter ATP-binding protein [Paenibacillus selenitireducens]OPA75626.1 ABC transporter ATP-binding protein [Paenibacillus selenitireducens]
MSNDHIVVQLEHVSKVIGGKTIIDDLSFAVKRGEVYGFLGPNGSGKTTTIRMMLGLISMTKGEIFIEGHSIKKERAKAVSYVGAIVENPELYKYMTGYKNLIHFARMSATPVSEERIKEIVKIVDLERAIHDKVKTYSLGMRQRLGIAQALLHHPSILILDEPTNGLDPAGIHELRDYLRKLAVEENIAVVVSSHLLAEIELMCDRVVIIQNGQYVDERTIKGVDTTHQKLPVVIEVDDRVLAKQLLEPYGILSVDLNTVTVELEKGQVPDVIHVLVQNNIRIYQVNTKKESLEDMFLSLTQGGNQ